MTETKRKALLEQFLNQEMNLEEIISFRQRLQVDVALRKMLQLEVELMKSLDPGGEYQHFKTQLDKVQGAFFGK